MWPTGFDRVAALGSSVWRARQTDGSGDVVVKIGPSRTDEAAGLRHLAAVEGGPSIPGVLKAAPESLVIEWIEPGPSTQAQEVELGRRLAVLHSQPWPSWGGGSSWIGDCRVDPATATDAAAFYGRRLASLADRCGLGSPVGALVDRLDSLIPPDPPALLHGDLWWGNVIWSAGGAPYLIDPSVHGGHPEEDLAMLSLFGPIPERLRDAYFELHPVSDGWRDRVALWQLYPLLVHTVLFGDSYRARAEGVCRRYR